MSNPLLDPQVAAMTSIIVALTRARLAVMEKELTQSGQSLPDALKFKVTLPGGHSRYS